MFLAPLFLFALSAAAIPLLLHLRRSTRQKKLPFSTTRFFDPQFIRATRRARFQDLLIMMLRVLLLALFVLALAQPVLKLPGLASLTGAKRNVAIVLDDSASMTLTDDKGTLFERSKSNALTLVNNLSSTRGDRATVILGGRRDTGPKALFDQPTTDLGAVRSAIEAATVTDLASDLTSAIEDAGFALGARPSGASDNKKPVTPTAGSQEVYVFSDMQDTAFAPRETVSPGTGASLIFVAATPSRPASVKQNISIGAVQYGASKPMLGVPFTFRTLVTNHGDIPRTALISLIIGGESVAQKTIELQPGRNQIVRFTHRFAKPGWFNGKLEVTAPTGASPSPSTAADIYTQDNTRHFALKVQDQVRILAINGSPSAVASSDELFFFKLAMSVNPDKIAAPNAELLTSPIKINVTLPDAVTPALLRQHDMVLMANVGNLAPTVLDALERFIDEGGSLFITLGDRVDARLYNAWTGPQRLHNGLLPGAITGPLNPAADTDVITAVTDGHPALAGFAEGQFGNLNAVRLGNRFSVDATSADVLMRTTNNDPVLVEKRFGRGRVLMFTSTLDRDWTSFPLQATYIPWLYRLVSYLAQGSLEDAGFVRTGQAVRLPASATQTVATQVVTPDGAMLYPQPLPPSVLSDAPHAGPVAGVTDTEKSGIYTLRTAPQPGATPTIQLLFAANTPADEGSTGRLDKASITSLIDPAASWDFIAAETADAPIDPAAGGRSGFGLWDQLLMLALFIGLFEPLLANIFTRAKQDVPQDALRKRTVDRTTPATTTPNDSTKAA